MSQLEAEYIDHMGTDKSVVNAARLSFGVGKIKAANQTLDDKDVGLINFLAKGLSSKDFNEMLEAITNPTMGLSNFASHEAKLHSAFDLYQSIRHQAVHWTPFSHTAISIRMKAPIPIRTQAFKHKQGLVENEESRRYITSTPEIFIPEFRSKPEGSIKQGSGNLHPENETWREIYSAHVNAGVHLYEQMIKDGVAPEQARMVLPQGAMVNWLWTGNLMSFANYYNKRTDTHAQGEGAELAKLVRKVVEPLFPVSWAALTRQV